MLSNLYFRLPLFVVWRAFQASVVIPASIAGGLILIYSLAGKHPIDNLIAGMYRNADISIRAAEPGHVMRRDCLEGEQLASIRPVVCHGTPRQVSIETAAADTSEALFRAYCAIVIISFFFHSVVLTPGRRYLGLPPKGRQPAAAMS